MKFICTVEIDAPREKVVELFRDYEQRTEWDWSFISIETLSEPPNSVGAKSRILFKVQNKAHELMETITVSNLPEEFSGFYEHAHMDNSMKNRFTELDDGRTRYEAEIEYTVFRGFMPKLFSFLFPGMFRRQVQLMLDRFKEFVERS